jgi:hypothetical protein
MDCQSLLAVILAVIMAIILAGYWLYAGYWQSYGLSSIGILTKCKITL